jgi:hypothetical protein
MKRHWLLFAQVAILVGLLSGSLEAQRGCCSWHGGVAYCDEKAGRYVCNDGTYSPSCGCSGEQVRQPVKKKTSRRRAKWRH